MDYDFYVTEYHGNRITQEEFPAAQARAADRLAHFKRLWTVTGSAQDEAMAVCAMADALYFYDCAANGMLVQSAKVGSVSSTAHAGGAADVSAAAQKAELLRCARTYLSIYRGVG